MVSLYPTPTRFASTSSKRFNISMIAKRVIPCLDVHDGQVTRGVQFGQAEKGELRNVGNPVELALRYNEQGADEMVFFDITASAHGRATMVDVIERAADQCFMPLTVGGGLRSVEDIYTMLRAGADKINQAATARTAHCRREVFTVIVVAPGLRADLTAVTTVGAHQHAAGRAVLQRMDDH